ncbi:DUF4870 family protein [Caulobacter sp. LARHSG274]
MSDLAHTPDRAEEDKLLPIVVYALYLLGFVNGLTFLAGLIVAYVNRSDAGPVNASHYTFAIRTFWMSIGWFLAALALFLVGLALSVVLIGIPLIVLACAIFGAIGLWFAVRTILGLVHLLRGEPYPRPQSWLI